MKTGVSLDNFTPNSITQLTLFDDYHPSANSRKLMSILDGINQSGVGSIWFARQGIDTDCKIKLEMISPAWTTNWKDIPAARICRI